MAEEENWKIKVVFKVSVFVNQKKTVQQQSTNQEFQESWVSMF